MSRHSALMAIGAMTALGLLAACSPSREPTGTATSPAPTTRPATVPVGAKFDYQLGGAYTPPLGTALVVRDSSAAPAVGLYNVCYVNGFQTQPAERTTWLEQRRDLVLSGVDGRPLVDDMWPDELIVDTSTVAKRHRLADVVGQTVKLCARKGYEAVEIDNLDSFSRSRGALTAEHNLAFAADLAQIAHASGLVIAQKNAAELSARAEQAGFDFAVAEECVRFRECDAYTDVYGDRVIDIEYTDNLNAEFTQMCDRPGTPKSTILRDRKLVPAGEPSYTYQRC